MAAIYSRRFFGQYVASATTVTTAAVPVGRVWVLRDINVVSGGAGGTGALLLVRYVESGTGRAWLSFVIDQGSKPYQWTGRLVMNAGETLQVVTAAVGAGVYVSGYELGTG